MASRILRLYRYKSDTSALAEKFQQILDEKVPSAPTSLMDKEPRLREMYAQYTKESSDKEFQHKYQKELAYVKSENLLRTKEARDLADTITNPPWRGTERVEDTALRMLVDSAPKAKAMPRQKTIISPPVPTKERIANARESSLDYKVSKTKTPEEAEKDNFREMYKERLMGPSMFIDATSPRTTLGMVTSLADARINAKIDQKSGKFNSPEMDAVRGKPLDRQRLANSTDTNFFVNEILNSQECLPPWIESQQGVEKEKQVFRLDLQKKWFNIIITHLSNNHGQSKSEILAKVAPDSSYLQKELYMPEFRRLYYPYISAKVDDLNKGIRNYNLQCPSPSLHKWKMTPENEISMSYDAVIKNLTALVDEWVERQNQRRQITPQKLNAGRSMLGLFESAKGSYGSGSHYQIIERPTEKMEFWKSVKSIFKPV
ncbi:hypothetical protein ACI3LY_003017 [Candidozyma auris]|uniref:DnaJ homologue subfamily C member 28 conserved domain-containing protein n=2 Tax=Candidozyma auris TaxID=498019 RepID=A0AB36W5U9_CANAR|nr:hypothetical protein QG37_00902 [[Candida] auris]PIS52104.1 hypothetical protein B9J08_003715 [[Candida] auris]PIS54091.1 hypothetical protein CJI97_003789 [[Candida] auris]QWW21593.1 hypothetical protein CA7LBN_000339 [[Candida] auris]